MKSPCVLFGGSFDPVHFGHLRMAVEVGELLQTEVRLVPSPAQAEKRNQASAQQRLAMLQLALDENPQSQAAQPRLLVDSSELDLRLAEDPRPVFTVDTLYRRRQQLAPHQPLVFTMGMDSFLNIRSWYKWQQLLEHAHLLVVRRPGSNDAAAERAVEALIEEADLKPALSPSVEPLLTSSAGRVHLATLSLLHISSSRIRTLISLGSSASFLTAPAVLDYIARNDLYKT